MQVINVLARICCPSGPLGASDSNGTNCVANSAAGVWASKRWLVSGCLWVLLALVLLVPLTFAQGNEPKLGAYSGTSAKSPTEPTPPTPPNPKIDQAELRLGVGDLVELTVFSVLGAPELSSKSRISTSGDLSVPLIGAVRVVGLNVHEAQEMIAKRFKDEDILKDPTVMMFVSEYVNRGVSVLGEVNKPGSYNVLNSRRLLDMISEAGGLTPMAGRTATITRRNNPKVAEVVTLSRDPSQALANNIEIFPGDTILVSKAGVVYVVGAVSKPGGFPMEANEGLTVLQVLALAEGSKPEAALDKSKLIRKTAAGPVEIPIPLRKILSSKASDQKLQTDDILFVPNSAARSAAKRTMDAIIQTATGVAIYSRR